MTPEDERKESALTTASTWLKALESEERSRLGFDALEAGRRVYEVVDTFGKSGKPRDERVQVLAGALIYYTDMLTRELRRSLARELEFAKKCDRERLEKSLRDAHAKAHEALTSSLELALAPVRAPRKCGP